jgi:hypothetical protein
MYPEVMEYFDTMARVDDEVRTFERDARADQPRWDDTDYDRRYSKWSENYYEEQRKYSAKRNKVYREALETLKEKTNDPMIKWMVDNLRGYQTYINSTLEILPATREELETLANTEDWCNEFDDFLSQATDAGVVPPPAEKYDASEIISWISEEFDVYGRRYRREVQNMVNKIVEKALADKAMADAADHNNMVTA